MKLSIIVPVYNEEKTIEEVLEKLTTLKLPWQKEIIVVDDGSTDATALEIRNSKFEIRNIQVFFHQTNRGKGAAIRTGIRHATGDYILIHDADLEYDPAQIPKLLEPITYKLNNKDQRLKTNIAASDAASRGKKPFDSPSVSSGLAQSKPITHNPQPTTNFAVYGSRFMHKNVAIPKAYYLGNKFLTWLMNICHGTKLTDMETCYKLIPNIIRWDRLKCSGFDIEPEITITLIKNRIPIIEVPIKYSSRSRKAGKKLTFKDAFSAVRVIIGSILENYIYL